MIFNINWTRGHTGSLLVCIMRESMRHPVVAPTAEWYRFRWVVQILRTHMSTQRSTTTIKVCCTRRRAHNINP